MRVRSCVVAGVLLPLLVACASTVSVPVVERAQPPAEIIDTHWVSAGETLYAIAWRYTMDVADLARANGLAPPYRIVAGQELNLRLSAVAPAPNRSEAVSDAVRWAKKKLPQKKASSQRENVALQSWRWPAEGKLVKGFRPRATPPHKGLDIRGRRGEPVYAANAGVVVYAGSGLPAYGRLLIVKHSAAYLSAYAHNSKLLVSEGDRVKRGEKIAEIGRSGTNYEHLHFEVRLRGRPIDPLKVLPKA